MNLLYSPLSPYVRKVMITAHETGQVDELTLVTESGTPIAPNDVIVAMNPVGKIPALETTDAGVIYDSRVICRYLNARAGASLYGSGTQEFVILTREALAEGMIDAALLAAYEWRLRPEEIRFQPWVDGQRDKIIRGFKAWNDKIADLSSDVTADQIALGTCCGYVDVRHADLGWRDVAPTVAEWFDAFNQRPSMQATLPKMP